VAGGTGSRAARLAGAVALGALCTGAQCTQPPEVTFEILMPTAIADEAQWMEIGVLSGSCPPPGQLAGGIPEDSALVRVAFQKGDTSPPAIGSLPKGDYAFAAAARRSDCTVLATGCTQTDVSQARDVTIRLGTVQTPAGACAAGETCGEGRCAPIAASGDPGLGAGCSMQLVGAGPLGDPLELSGTVVASAPAAAATESGFLVAYREYDPVQGAARLTVVAIDAGGAAAIATPTLLPGQCPSLDESDGVGLAYLGGAGVVVSARPACPGGTAGFDAYAVDAAGNATQPTFTSTASAPALSNAHSTALTGAGAGWLAALEQGAPSLYTLAGLAPQGGPTRFGAGGTQKLADVVATSQMVALLSGDGTTLAPALGTSPAGGDAGAGQGFAATWGALAADAGRAFVLSDGGGGATPLQFHAFDLGASGTAASGAFAAPGSGAVLGGDVALLGDRVAFALEQAGALSVVVYDHASTTPSALRTVLLSGDARYPATTTVRDGRVAVAAAGSRVLVTWITALNLAPNDPLGGYALFACAP